MSGYSRDRNEPCRREPRRKSAAEADSEYEYTDVRRQLRQLQSSHATPPTVADPSCVNATAFATRIWCRRHIA
jgi:hypothetical protein